jgi:hypothetical protein
MNYYARQTLNFLNDTAAAFKDNFWDNFRVMGAPSVFIGITLALIPFSRFAANNPLVNIPKNLDAPITINGQKVTIEPGENAQASQQALREVAFYYQQQKPAVSFTMPQPLWAYVAGGAAIGLVTLPVLATGAMAPFIAYRRQRQAARA